MLGIPTAPTIGTTPNGVAALRARIAWLCHALRLAALAYALWVLAAIGLFWRDPAMVARGYGHWLGGDLAGITTPQLAAGAALHLGVWLLVAAACREAWRLFSGFLVGEVFARPAALRLRRMAIYGLAATVTDILARPLIAMIVTAHLPAGSRMVGVFTRPEDLLTVMLLAAFLALGHVFSVAAELAEDNAAII